MQNYTYFKQFYLEFLSRIYSLPMNLHKHQLYLLEQHSESFTIWSAIIRINTEGKSLYEIGPSNPKFKCWIEMCYICSTTKQ